MSVYRLVQWVGKYVYVPLFNPKIIGKENIPETGPVIIASNHTAGKDALNILRATKREVHFLAKKELFENKLYSWIFKGVKCIPVDRSRKNPEAMKAAIDFLKQGGVIGIFPEGTRNRSTKLLPFKFGAVSLAQKTGATIVPLGISGKYSFRSKNLTARFGKPFKVKKSDDLEGVNQKLKNEVEKLIKESTK